MTKPPDLNRFHWLRWRVVTFSLLLAFAALGYLLASVWSQGDDLDRRVQRNLERSHRIEAAVDSVRVPVCAILYASLSRPTTGFTPQQVQARQVYITAYGPGTVEHPGLNCPDRLPVR